MLSAVLGGESSRASDEGGPIPAIRNVLLISIDTCRADHLSSYGYRHQTTPHIDAIARDGIVFENAVSPIPLTLPAHATMMTSTIPPYHGVRDNYDYRVGASLITLAEILHDRSFVTGAVVGAHVLAGQFGLNQGFDDYHDRFDDLANRPGEGAVPDRRAEEVTHYGLAWLEKHFQSPFFLFLHYFDPHQTYDPPEPFRSRFPGSSTPLYDGEIAYTDYWIGRLINRLKEMKIYESTLIIITSDHGEMLGEHGESTHGYFIYQSALEVPLILKLPGRQGPQRVSSLVGIVDIVPTICGLMGIETPAPARGIDLTNYLRESEPPVGQRALYCENLFPTKYKSNALFGLVTEPWKYIETTRPELYHLDRDPAESRNLAKQELRRATELRQKLEEMLQDETHDESLDKNFEVDEETRSSLESLGYVAGSVHEDIDFDQDKSDPKDLIDYHEIAVRVAPLISENRYAEAKDLAETMVTMRPELSHGYLGLARLSILENRLGKAVGHLRQALKVDPENGRVLANLGFVRSKQGQWPQAILHYRQGLELDPDSFETHYNLAHALNQQGKHDEAITHYRRAIQVNPDFVEGHMGLGNTLLDQGHMEQAVPHLEQAVRIWPDHADAYSNLGRALAMQGLSEQAESHFRRAVRIDKKHVEALTNLGVVLAGRDRFEEALGLYERALREDPNHVRAHSNFAYVLAQLGRDRESVVHYRQILKKQPAPLSAALNLAWVLATSRDASVRDGKQAVQWAEQCAKLTGHQAPEVLDKLAAAYAEVGRFKDAVSTAELALVRCRSIPECTLSDQIGGRLNLYRKNQPYRR